MLTPKSVKALEDLGRVRLSQNFFMRDFVYSEIAMMAQIPNAPEDPDLAIAAGTRLCEELLEPLQDMFGRITVRSAYRSCAVNAYGNEHGLNCASNESNYTHHIWDRLDKDSCMGATACIVLPWFADYCERGASWQELAWWVHDHLPYSEMVFFPKLAAFNINWHEKPKRRIKSHVGPKGTLTNEKDASANADHSALYRDMLDELTARR